MKQKRLKENYEEERKVQDEIRKRKTRWKEKRRRRKRRKRRRRRNVENRITWIYRRSRRGRGEAIRKSVQKLLDLGYHAG